MDDSVIDKLDSRSVDSAKIEKKKKKSIFQKLDSYLSISFFVYFVNSILLDVVMSCFASLIFLKWNTFFKLAHHFYSLAVLCSILAFIGYLVKILIKMEIKKKDRVENIHVKTKFKTWLFLRLPIKPEAPTIAQFGPEYLTIQEFLSCIFIVTFHFSGVF